MRAELTFLAGLAAGGAGAFAALSAARGDGPQGPVALHSDASAPAGSAFPETVATLRMTDPVPEPSVPARGTPEGAAVVEVDLADFAALVKATPPAEPATWHLGGMLARTFARAGRVEALLRVIDAALAAGERPDVVLGWISVLPEDRRIAALTGFTARHPEAKASPGVLAWAWFGAGDVSKAFPFALEQIALVKGQDGLLLTRMYAADADKADGAAWRLAHEQDWAVSGICQALSAAASVGRVDLVARWQEQLQRVQGPAVAVEEPMEAQLAKAVTNAEQNTRESPDDADAWVSLANARDAAGEHRSAIEAWRTAIEKAGPDANLLRQFVEADPAAAFGTVEAAAREAQEDDVLLVFCVACLRVGKAEEAGAAFFRMHTLENAEWLEAGIAALAPSAALARMDRLLAHREHKTQNHFRMARADALLALGRSSAAYAEYQRLAEEGYDDWRVRDGLARADPARAAARFEALRTAPEPDDTDGLAAAHALALLRAGRADAAKAIAEPTLARYEATENYDEEALRRLGLVAPERVLALLRVRIDHGDESCLETTASVLLGLGRGAEARPIYDRLLKDDGQAPGLLISRGRCR